MMKYLTQLVILFVFAAVCPSQDKTAKVTSLGWISGCWEMTKDGAVTTERWGQSTDNFMIGNSQTVKNGRTLSFEFLQIVNNGHGIMYVARPSSQLKDTPFVIKRLTENEVMFENLKNDFPQRVIYRRSSKNELFARIEGIINSKEESEDFPYKRVKCE